MQYSEYTIVYTIMRRQTYDKQGATKINKHAVWPYTTASSTVKISSHNVSVYVYDNVYCLVCI
jgi:hypothetical protein